MHPTTTPPTIETTLGAASPGATVPALIQHAYGNAEVVRPGERVVPALGPNDVAVAVHAAAIDRGTWHLMTGTPTMVRPAIGLRRPRNPIPGRDLAGVVLDVGTDVTGLRPGDRVHGTANGSLTTVAVTTADRLAPVPDGLGFVQAAAMPVSGVTALGAVEHAHVAAGQRVLVTGASGGVGTFAVQLAVGAGAEVTASCRGAAAERMTALGAAHVVDRTTTDPFVTPDAYDVVIDIAGRPSVGRLRHALRRGGTAMIVGGEGGSALVGGMTRQLRAVAISPFVPERLTMLVARERGSDLARLDQLLVDGTVTPVIDSTFGLDEFASAMARLTSGDVIGKVVIEVRPG